LWKRAALNDWQQQQQQQVASFSPPIFSVFFFFFPERRLRVCKVGKGENTTGVIGTFKSSKTAV
jgi:hypothetical protein